MPHVRDCNDQGMKTKGRKLICQEKMEPGRKAKVQGRGEVLETVEKKALHDQRIEPGQAKDRALGMERDRIAKVVLERIKK